MTSTKRRFFLAGGLSVAIAIVLGIMLSMSALAAPAARERGTLELIDSDDDPLTIISSDTAVDTGDRTVTVTVEDPDLIRDIGDTGDGAQFGVSVVVPSEASDAGAAFNITLNPTTGTTDATITVPENAPDADVDDITPIVGDVAVIGDMKDKVMFVRILNRTTGLVRFETNDAGLDGDRFVLQYQTTDSKGLMAEVSGEGGSTNIMQLALPEGTGSANGKYTGQFVVADEVTIDLNNLRQEQYEVPGNRAADEEFDEQGGYQVPAGYESGTFPFTLKNIPLRDTDGNDTIDEDDVTINHPTMDVQSYDADTGVVTVEAAQDQTITAGTRFTVTYDGAENFTIKLGNAPVQGMVSTADHTLDDPDIDSLVSLDNGAENQEPGDVHIVAPGPDAANLLYQAIRFNPVSGELTLAVLQDTPSGGSYIGVSYGAAIEGTIDADGVDPDNSGTFTSTVTLMDVRGIPADAVSVNDFTLIEITATDGVSIVTTVAVDTGDSNNRFEWVRLTVSASTQNAPKLAKDGKLYFVYNQTDVEDDVERPIDAFFNPQGSMKAEPNDATLLPIVTALSNGSVRVTYRDNSPPNATDTETITIDGDAPMFQEANPAHNSTSSDEDVDLSIEISDQEDAVDGDSIKVFVQATEVKGEIDPAVPFTVKDDLDEAITVKEDDIEVSSADGVYTITVNLDDLFRDVHFDKTLEAIDRGKQTYLWWWVQASDMSGNRGVSDAVTDVEGKTTTKGSQPYVLTIDQKAPEMALDGSTTGESWDPDADDVQGTGDDKTTYTGLIKGNNRNSIRVVFTEELDGDSIDAGDFRVSVGTSNLNVEEALHYTAGSKTHERYADIAMSVFLVMSEPLDPDATPKVTLAGPVADLAGRSVSQDSVTVEDGLAPKVEVSVSSPVSSGDGLKITVTTDEDIRPSSPTLELFMAPDEDDDGKRDKTGDDPDKAIEAPFTVQVGTASRVGRANEWVFSPTFGGGDSGKYSVYVTQAEDNVGNEGKAGNQDPDNKAAITFEIDKEIGFTVGTGDTDDSLTPAEDSEVSVREPYYITIDWKSEGSEYPGDSQKAITLTKAVLDEGEDNERNLMADPITLDEGRSDERTLEGENLVSVRNQSRFTITISNIGTGDHTLTFNGMDSQGNTLEDDETLTFEVMDQPKFKLDLAPGMNLVSIPNSPADTDINAVLGQYEEINLVITQSGGVWVTATRDEDTGMFEATGTATDLTTIDAGHAYYIRTTAPVIVEVDIPSADILREIPSVAVKGGQWNLVPVISILPIGTNEGEIQAGDEVDADEYFGSGLTIYTLDRGRIVSVSQGKADEPVTKGTEDDDKGPIYESDGEASTGAEFGKGYWVFYEFDGVILPAG